ncbi:MAG: hypothetical protein KC643_26935 [Nitrospira sp.]|nr:hypothetical protein [Nitrospira sp.]
MRRKLLACISRIFIQVKNWNVMNSTFFLFPVCLLALVGNSSCANRHVVSSPEGTVTSFVEDSGVLVYAPRAARAQKVVFDTPDQQLIHKPDTPFRKFFDSHASDFAGQGKLEYAKTTILSDIVNMVRNKEFIREMIRNVVDEHLDSAIAPSIHLTQPILDARTALSKLNQLLPEWPQSKSQDQSNNKMQEIIKAANEAALKIAEAADSACLGVENGVCNKSKDFLKEAWEELNRSGLTGSPSSAENFQTVHKKIQTLSTSLSQILRTAGNGSFVPLSQLPSFDNSTGNIRKRNAALLVNELFKNFEAADYPNMRPAEISQSMEEFDKKPVWLQTTIQVGSPAEDGEKVIPPALDLKRHLTQALLEQRYFRLIIDKAVGKRKNLFFTKSSPVQPLRTAQAQIEKFFKENVGNDLVKFAGDNTTSLWTALITHLNGTQANQGIFIQPGTQLILNQAEKMKFGGLLRKKLAGSLTGKVDLEKAMTAALQDQELQKYLRASDEKPLGPNDPASLEQRQKVWVEELKHIQTVKNAFTKLKDQAQSLKTVKGEKDTREKVRDEAEKSRREALGNIMAGGGIPKLKGFIGKKLEAQSKLEKLGKTLKEDSPLEIPLTTQEKKERLFQQARILHEKVTTYCSKNNSDNKCQDQGSKSLWPDIDSQSKSLRALLNGLEPDQGVTRELTRVITQFEKDPDQIGQSQTIVEAISKFQLNYDEIFTQSETLKNKMEEFAILWCPDNNQKCEFGENHEKWAYELKKNLPVYSPIFPAKGAKDDNEVAQIYVPKSGKVQPLALFNALDTAEKDLSGKEEALKSAEKTFNEIGENYLKAEQKDADSFLGTLLQEIDSLNKKKQEVHRLKTEQTEEIKKRIVNYLEKAREGDGLESTETVEAVLTHGLAVPLNRNINASVALFATQFAATFRNNQQLIQSESPILKGFLESGGVVFNTGDFKNQAIALIPEGFVAAWKEQGQGKAQETPGSNTGTTKTPLPNVEKAIEILKQVLEQPQIAYLFGDDGTTAPVVGAFKEELYNAFKHRVFEAVKAEQEADYSYWWLTFFPKAIPLGDQRLEGQSIIEVGFPNSITPEEQYHRWLQDQVGGLYVEQKSRRGKSTDYDETEKKYRLKVQASTSVLNDFLVVLDSSELTPKYPKIRGIINRAVAELTHSEEGKVNYQNNYTQTIQYLYQETLREWEYSPPPPFKLTESGGFYGKSGRPGAQYLGTFSPEFSCQNGSKSEVSADFLRQCLNNDQCFEKIEGEEERKHLRESAGIDLAWDRFGLAHVLFAVTSAAETQETLPFKIELYVNAFFDGSRRFSVEILGSENKAEAGYLEDSLNTWFLENPNDVSLLRFLALNKFSEKTVADFLLQIPGMIDNLGVQVIKFLEKQQREVREILQLAFDKEADNLKNQVRFHRLALGLAEYDLYLELQNLVVFQKKEILPLINSYQKGNDCKNGDPNFEKLDSNQKGNDCKNGDPIFGKLDSKQQRNLENLHMEVLFKREKIKQAEKLVKCISENKSESQAIVSCRNDQTNSDDLPRITAIPPDLKIKDLFSLIQYRILMDRNALSETFRDISKTEIKKLFLEAQNTLAGRALENRFENFERINLIVRDIMEKGTYDLFEKTIFGEDSMFGLSSLLWNIEDEGSDLPLEQNSLRRKIFDDCKSQEVILILNLCEPSIYLNKVLGADYRIAFDPIHGSQIFKRNSSNEESLQKNNFLRFPHLWKEEEKLQALRENLRIRVVNMFQTNYPGVPDPLRIKNEFGQIQGHLRSFIYEWIRPFWAQVEEERILFSDDTLDMKIGRSINPISENKKKRFLVLLNHFLDQLPILTMPSRDYLMKNLGYYVGWDGEPTTVFGNRNIFDWINVVTSNQKLMDELSKHLIDHLYRSYWEALGKLSRVERHPVPFSQLQAIQYEEFSHWAKPHIQTSIQIVDLLPASRDDLVSMSINEGGAVAKIAAQAEGAAAYDINKLRMGAEVLDDLRGDWKKIRESSVGKSEEPVQGFDTTTIQRQRISDAEELVDTSSLRQKAESFGYGAGGRAKGSIYARAKAALAYSKRREYLDAAITASGRGDNFAKWVVRRSDLRSNLASLRDGQLVAAAHSGFPNGDQPFHMLVKIPDQALQRDWEGKNYILFNSSYSATKRQNLFKAMGWAGLVTRGIFGALNPALWEDVEEDMVGTVYPFMWDVKDRYDQVEMLKHPNTLGGRIYLDDTDKVKYSEVRTLLEAESGFIKATRSAQNGDLNSLMGNIQEEAENFRGKVDEHLENIRDQEKTRLQEQRERNKRNERIQSLQDQPTPPAEVGTN